jgi:HEAT repeat protein
MTDGDRSPAAQGSRAGAETFLRPTAPGGAGVSPIPGLDSLTSASLRRALDDLEIRPEELGFDKLYAEDDTFRLSIVEDLLNDPLRVPRWQTTTVADLRARAADLPGLVAALGRLCEAPGGSVASNRTGTVRTVTERSAGWGRPDRPGAGYREPVDRFVQRCRIVEAALRQAFARLDDRDRATILSLAPAFWGDWEDPDSPDKERRGALHRELGGPMPVGGKKDEITADQILNASLKLDRPALTRASELFFAALADLSADVLRPGTPWTAEVKLKGVTGRISALYETPWGLLAIGGPGPNIYSEEALARIAFLIEPGGDDLYRGRAASAVGGLLRPFGAIVDASGDDIYESGERSFCLGGAVLGIAALIDEGGDDSYRGEDGTEGAGFFGVGFLYDGAGVDYFEGRNFCQGAGGFGLGALISGAAASPPPGPPPEKDVAFARGIVKAPGTGSLPVRYDENDIYQCARNSQGFASTFGAGLLYDKAGNDVYRAGGHYLHRPLRPNDFQSLSQGFSIGFRPRAGGGVGVLIDDEGNDFYNAEIYSQGSSYWYSVGLLCDRGGNDRYHATQYSQGAGIHLSVGTLWDLGGDDQYVSQLGVTQGTAHDLSVGYLIDESGDDYYVVDGGQGFSITNSVAIFIDKMGNDIYATQRYGQGALTWARGFCAPGIFLDLEGTDYYPALGGGRDSTNWTQDLYGVGIDLGRDVTLPGEAPPEIVLTPQDLSRSIPDLFEDASMWEVGSAVEKVRRARKALIAKGVPAIDYVVQEKLASDDGLAYRAMVDLGQAYPDQVAARVIPRLLDPNVQVQRNVISLLGEMKRRDARDPLLSMLARADQKKHWTRIIQALGTIGDPAAAPSIRPFLGDPVERRRIAACVALGALKDTTSVGAMTALLDDSQLTVRSAASAAIVPFGTVAVDPLVAHLGAAPAHPAVATRTLGTIAAGLRAKDDAGSRKGLAGCRTALLTELDRSIAPADPAARAAAVTALMGLNDPAVRDRVAGKMQGEADPLVRRAYERARPANRE